MATKTTTPPADPVADAEAAERAAGERLAAARQDEAAAAQRLAAERERAGRGGSREDRRTAEADAGFAADAAAKAAEDLAAAQRATRQARLVIIAEDITQRARGVIDADAEAAAAAAVAAALRRNTEHGQLVAQWTAQLRGLGVPATPAGATPAEDDAGCGWRGTGWGGSPACVITPGQVVQAGQDPSVLVERILSRAAHEAGTTAAALQPPG